MKRKSTTKNLRTRITHFTWVGALVIAALIFARCYEWTTIDQPATAQPNSSFDVNIVLKIEDGKSEDFAYELRNKGIFGVQMPEGWSIENDSFLYNIKGIYQNTSGPYEFESYITYDATYAQMYEDSVGSDAGYYWWGGISDTANVDNLDSISVSLTILTDDQEGTFDMQYAMGTLDYPEGRMPVAEGGLSPKVPITIQTTGQVKRYIKNQLSIYPNPATEILNVDVGEIEAGELELYSLSGQLQLGQPITSKLQMLDISDIPEGTYLLRVKTQEGSYAKKVVVH
jgi:hypothetical protein